MVPEPARIMAVIYSAAMNVKAMGMFKFPGVEDVRIANFESFHAHVVMSQEGDAVPANPVKYKPPADESIVIGQKAAPEEERHPAERRSETHVIMHPEMVEGNKDKHVGAKTEAHIHPDAAVPH
jgi:hypothetical protein